MLSWRIFTDPYSIATIVLPLVVLLWLCGRALFAGRLTRGPRCGACKHEAAIPPGDRCPECGLLYTDAGITTKRLRRLGAFPLLLVLAAWTALCAATGFGIAKHAAWEVERHSWQQLSDMQSINRPQQMSFRLEFKPRRKPPGGQFPWSVQPYEIIIEGDLEQFSGVWEPATFRFEIIPESGVPCIVSLSFPDRLWSAAPPFDQVGGKGVFDEDALLQLLTAMNVTEGDNNNLAAEVNAVIERLSLLARDPTGALETDPEPFSHARLPSIESLGQGTWKSVGTRGNPHSFHIKLSPVHSAAAFRDGLARLFFQRSGPDAEWALTKVEAHRFAELKGSLIPKKQLWRLETDSPGQPHRQQNAPRPLDEVLVRSLSEACELGLLPVESDDFLVILDSAATDAEAFVSKFTYYDDFLEGNETESSADRESAMRISPRDISRSLIGTNTLQKRLQGDTNAAIQRSNVLVGGASTCTWLLGAILLLVSRPRLPRPDAG